MLKTILKPHRGSLKAGQTQPQKLFAMLKVIPDAEAAQSRPPLALSLVIDTSASMRLYADQAAAERLIEQHRIRAASQRVDGVNFEGYHLGLPTLLDQAIQAAHTMVEDPALAPTDYIAIIHFDDDAHTLLPLTPLAQKPAIHQAIETLRDFAGGTHMARGLRCALSEMSRLPPEVAKRTLLLTDGAAMDENECLQLMAHFAAANTPVIGIGCGVEYNDDLLAQLANATNGRPYHLMQMTELAQWLQAEVGQTAREVVTDLKATIATVRGVQIDSVSRLYPSLNDVNLSETPYRLGNIATGDFTVFIIEMTAAGVERPPSRVRLAQVGLTANAPGLQRAQELPPLDLVIEFTNDEAAIAAVDAEVVGFVQQKNVGRMVNDAVRTAPVDASRARQTLQAAAGMTQRLGNTAMTKMLNDAISELDQTGHISPATSKTVALNTRTKTVKTQPMDAGGTGLSPEELRRLSGT
jgi:Ca-activated chloride channel family protein